MKGAARRAEEIGQKRVWEDSSESDNEVDTRSSTKKTKTVHQRVVEAVDEPRGSSGIDQLALEGTTSVRGVRGYGNYSELPCLKPTDSLRHVSAAMNPPHTTQHASNSLTDLQPWMKCARPARIPSDSTRVEPPRVIHLRPRRYGGQYRRESESNFEV